MSLLGDVVPSIGIAVIFTAVGGLVLNNPLYTNEERAQNTLLQNNITPGLVGGYEWNPSVCQGRSFLIRTKFSDAMDSKGNKVSGVVCSVPFREKDKIVILNPQG